MYSVVSSIAFKPTVTKGEFPFSITYELDGKTVTINEVYKARYVRNDGYADTKSRVYVGETWDSRNTIDTHSENASVKPFGRNLSFFR